ncbi:MAG TPA: ribbon-helix-helix protein, CopG family [Baekduia sp.]|nr:ribbon-helix-helix protein, CopG family [Baekduia sp.]
MKKTSLYLDPDLDAALARRAADEGLTKAELIRRTLAAAVQRPARPRLAVGTVRGGTRSREFADVETELLETGFGER